MNDRSPLFDVRDHGAYVVFGLTAVVVFLGRLTAAYQGVLRAVLHNTFSLSPFGWAVYTAGAFLVTPILLFWSLYVIGSRTEIPVSVTFIAGLGVAVVIGATLGEYVGFQLWGNARDATSGVSFRQAWVSLLALDPISVGYWRVLVEPVTDDFLTALAGLGLANMTD